MFFTSISLEYFDEQWGSTMSETYFGLLGNKRATYGVESPIADLSGSQAKTTLLQRHCISRQESSSEGRLGH